MPQITIRECIIPVDHQENLSVTFSLFNPEHADYTFNARIHFTDKDINFYKASRYFTNRNLDNLASVVKTYSKKLNRVSPQEPTGTIDTADITSPPVTESIEMQITAILATLAAEKARGKTYQFNRIIISFDTTYNKSQQSCCGLIGYSLYDLYKLSRPIEMVLGECITKWGGVAEANHIVRVIHRDDQYL